MNKINNPHDKFFKEMMGNIPVAKDFLQHYLPEQILGIIELETVTPQKDSFISAELDDYFSDLLFRVKINDEEAYIYFLLEHKTYEQNDISLQLLTYMIEIWKSKLNKQKELKLPIIIPLVIYHGRKNWTIGETLADLITGYEQLSADIQKYIPNYKYLLYDITTIAREDIKGTNELQLFLKIIKYIFETDIEQSIIIVENASIDVETGQLERTVFNTLITYILHARDDVPVENLKERLTVEGRKIFMSVADQLREQGIEKGIKEVAKKMLQLKIDEQQIIDATGLTKNELEQIKDSSNH